MYYIVQISGIVREIIDKTGKPNKYGEPKLFETREAAEMWTLKRVYKGMTHRYEIMKEGD